MQALQLIISTSTRADLNLALEEQLFSSQRNVLLLYRNADAVVIGKHQNPWKEVNIPYCKEHGIQIIRRLSGGGTVFHDLGNLNFSFIRSRTEDLIDFRSHIAPISRALESLGVNNHITERNDIFIDDNKISGNAEHVNQVHKRILHHGTLLYQSDLDRLRAAIHSELEGIRSHAVDSVRSKVRSISEVASLGSAEAFLDQLVQALPDHLTLTSTEELDPATDPDISRLAEEKYRSWEWNFGRSPQFDYQGPMATLTIRKGKIIAASSDHMDPYVLESFHDCTFDRKQIREELPEHLHSFIPELIP